MNGSRASPSARWVPVEANYRPQRPTLLHERPLDAAGQLLHLAHLAGRFVTSPFAPAHQLGSRAGRPTAHSELADDLGTADGHPATQLSTGDGHLTICLVHTQRMHRRRCLPPHDAQPRCMTRIHRCRQSAPLDASVGPVAERPALGRDRIAPGVLQAYGLATLYLPPRPRHPEGHSCRHPRRAVEPPQLRGARTHQSGGG